MHFEPRPWQPPIDHGLVGDYATNERLTPAALWDTGGIGPEDIAIDQEGRPVTGLEDGRIIRYPDDSGIAVEIGNTGGRPLGIEATDGDGFIIADAFRGLLHMAPNGTVTPLAESFQGDRFALTNNASVARDRTIYFTVSSHRWDLDDYTADVLERSATGRLYRRDPNGELTVLLDGLVFANGVALSEREDFVLVAETGSYRIHRVWLTGDRSGRSDIFVDNLPGFPNNLTRWHSTFWCAFPRLRDRAIDLMMPRPWMRSVVHRLPEQIQPKVGSHGFVAAYDHEGRVVTTLQDPTGRVGKTTGATAEGFRLYVGSLTNPALAVTTLPKSFEV